MTAPLLWLSVATALFYISRLIFIPKRLPGIPYSRVSYIMPWGDLVNLGISFFARGEVFAWFNAQSHHHRSPIYQAFIPSFSTSFPVIVVTDPTEIREIVTRRLSSIDRSKLMGQWFGLLAPGASIGMSSGPAFRALRWTWNSMLSPAFLDTVAGPRVRDAALGLVELWSWKATKEQDTAFEACADLRLATLEAMVATLLGKDLGLLRASVSDLENKAGEKKVGRLDQAKQEDLPRRLYRDFNVCLVCLDWVTQGISPTLYLWVFKNLFWPFQKAQKQVEACLQRTIDDARHNSGDRAKGDHYPDSALELVLERAARRPAAEDATSDVALRSELIELLITGHETTASSIGWALKYLADNEDAQETLHEELVRALPDSCPVPTSGLIMTTPLPYLDSFIAETLRHSCTGPISLHEAIQDCTILGHRIPSGTPIVLMTQDVMHREVTYLGGKPPLAAAREGSHDQPVSQSIREPPLNEFSPGRWLSAGGEFDPKATASIAFSRGLRACFGKNIAMLEMRIFLAILVWHFGFAKLSTRLSRYGSLDGLTRKPSCCFVLPVPRREWLAKGAKMDSPRLPPLCEAWAK